MYIARKKEDPYTFILQRTPIRKTTWTIYPADGSTPYKYKDFIGDDCLYINYWEAKRLLGKGNMIRKGTQKEI